MNQIVTVANVVILQDAQGRYCLNDLHKAAGGEKRHQPSDWLRLEQTKELIAEIESNSIPGIPGIESKQGSGTYVAKELVYAYAMWVSPKFHLHVIRAYDAMVMAEVERLKMNAENQRIDRHLQGVEKYVKSKNLPKHHAWGLTTHLMHDIDLSYSLKAKEYFEQLKAEQKAEADAKEEAKRAKEEAAQLKEKAKQEAAEHKASRNYEYELAGHKAEDLLREFKTNVSKEKFYEKAMSEGIISSTYEYCYKARTKVEMRFVPEKGRRFGNSGVSWIDPQVREPLFYREHFSKLLDLLGIHYTQPTL